MKKIKNIISLLVITFLLTGCVKYNVTMDIKKDKSMNFKIVYAVDKSLLEGKDSVFDDDELEKIKKSGFEAEKYNKDNMVGFTLTKKIKNIDSVSSKDDKEYSLSGIVENGDEKLFKVKKGLFKNKYTANLKFDSSDSGLGGDSNDVDFREADEDDIDDDDTTLDDDDTTLDDDLDDDYDYDDEDEDEDDDTDYSKAMESMGNMDMSFNVILPYKAISNNATKVENDGKNLKWDLSSMSGDASSISFEFELYNMTMIYICVGAALLVILVIVMIIVSKGKKKAAKVAEQVVTATPQVNTTEPVGIATPQVNTDIQQTNTDTQIPPQQ